MMKYPFQLVSSKPFTFGGYCIACLRQTSETIAIDVSQRKNIGIALAEIAFPPVALLDLKNSKSVRIPYCNTCRFLVWILRLFSFLAFVGLLTTLVLVVSNSDSKLSSSNAKEYLLVTVFFGIVLMPFAYTFIKEFLVGVEVIRQEGVYCYRFRVRKFLEFLENRRLCRQLRDRPHIYVAAQSE